jgi:hypothetical protein
MAKKSMLKLYGYAPGYDVVSGTPIPSSIHAADNTLQEYEYRVVQHGIEAERQFNEASKDSSFFEIFNRANWRRTLAGCIGICSQWSAGAPIVFSYSTVSPPSRITHVLVQYKYTRSCRIADVLQYFFKVANLGTDPFIITILT